MSSINVLPSYVMPPQNRDRITSKPIQMDQKNLIDELMTEQDPHVRASTYNVPELTAPQQVKESGNNTNINNARTFADSKTDSRDVEYLEKLAQSHGDNLTSGFREIMGGDINNNGVAEARTVSSSSFKNMFGDLNMLSVSNLVILMTNSTRTLFNKMTADSIRRMVGAAIDAGKHIIASAKQNFSGALTSGIVGSGVQVGSGVSMCKAIKNESKSINGNLKAANIKNLEVKENQDNIQKVLQQLKKEGKSPDDDVIQNMTRSHNKLQAEAANHQIDHQKNSNNTYQMRAKTDLVNQLNHSGQQAIVAGFGINAATETSQAEVLKSGQQVHHDVSDNHKQRNKGSEETQASINQFVEAWIANNNSAASAIAGR